MLLLVFTVGKNVMEYLKIWWTSFVYFNLKIIFGKITKTKDSCWQFVAIVVLRNDHT